MKHLLFIFFCIIFCSCSKKQEYSSIIPIKNTFKETTSIDLFENIEYIPLETTSKSIFGRIDKLIPFKNKFYILDKSQMKKIYVFNDDGSFSHTIGELGNGRGEYINIEDFTINEESNEIVILSYPSTISVYNLEGEFLYSKKLKESLFWNICSYKDGFVCSTNHQTYIKGDGAYVIFIYDKKFKLQNKFVPVLPIQVKIPPFISNPLLTDEKNIVYFDNFTSTIYLLPIDNPKDIHSVHFDLESPISNEILDAPANQFFSKQKEFSFFLEAFYKKGQLLSFYSNKGKLSVLSINLKTGKKRVSLFKGQYPHLLAYKNNYFYSTANPNRILEGNEPSFSPSKVITTYPIDEDSNPIIIRFSSKEMIE